MIDKYLEITKKIATACGVFAAASIMLSIVIVTELVFERYIFGNAITWQPELVTHLLVASTFIGSAYVFAENGHVNMDYFYTFLSEKGVTILQISTSLLCLIFFRSREIEGRPLREKYRHKLAGKSPNVSHQSLHQLTKAIAPFLQDCPTTIHN